MLSPQPQLDHPMAAINSIEGIGDVYQKTLVEVGIDSVEKLLEQGAKRATRETLAASTKISPKLLLRWVNHADLFRIKGIATQFAELLEASGVDTVVALAQRNAAYLHEKLVKVNGEKKLVRQVPAQSQIESFIKQANDLPRVVEY